MPAPHIEQIKQAITIADFIGEYIQVTRAGVNFKARCPFHNEKSPSFMISNERQSWHCFGCNEGGDVFTFLQKMEGLSFPEALKILADRTGVEIPRQGNAEYQSSVKNRGKDVLEFAALFYHAVLNQSPRAEAARAYVTHRGLDSVTLKTWTVGYAPDAFDALLNAATKRGIGVDDLLASGLIGRTERGGYYDRFRDRVMFPIRDHHGAVVGFTGRLLVEKEHQGKYVNTPQTALFDKGALLYGLNRAKVAIKKEKSVVIVEGQMDVITAHQFGFEHTVASSGTALTDIQLQLLKRYTDTIIMAFDQDSAGRAAALRGIMIALARGLEVKVIVVPEGAGKDADEIIRKDKQVWADSVRDAVPFIEFAIASAVKTNDITSAKGKAAAVGAVIPFISSLESPVEREVWIQMLARQVGIRFETVIQEMNQQTKRVLRSSPPIVGGVGGGLELKPQVTTSPFVRLLVLHLKLGKPIETFPDLPESVFLEEFRPLYRALKNPYTDGTPIRDAEEPQHVLSLMADHLYGNLSQKEVEEEYARLTARCQGLYLQAKKAHLEGELRIAESTGDTVRAGELLAEYMKLSNTAH